MTKERKDEWLREPVSKDLKKQIFAKAQIELKENKQRHLAQTNQAQDFKFFKLSWLKSLSFASLTLALIGVFAMRSLNVIDVQRPMTTFTELAALTPEEFEVIDNLEFIDDLDNIDLDKIQKEMKEDKANKG